MSVVVDAEATFEVEVVVVVVDDGGGGAMMTWVAAAVSTWT